MLTSVNFVAKINRVGGGSGTPRGIRERNLDAGASRRLHTAEVVDPERFADRGIKGIFGESEACLALSRLHTGGIVAPLIVLIKF